MSSNHATDEKKKKITFKSREKGSQTVIKKEESKQRIGLVGLEATQWSSRSPRYHRVQGSNT